MAHKLSSAAAALLIGASAATGLGVHVSHAASTSKQTHFADALLWPYQGHSNGGNGNGSNSSGGSTDVLWQNSNVPGGSFAILTGQGGNLNFILHAKYLQPNQNYTAYIGNGACGNTSGSGASSGNGGVSGGNGNSGGNGSTALANYQLGKQKSSAGGAITVVGKLDLTKLPTSFATGTSGSGGSSSGGSNGNNSGGNGSGNTSFSVHVEPASMASSGSSSGNSSSSSASGGTSGIRAYCGDIVAPQAVIPLKSINGSHVLGDVLVSRGGNIWWKSTNTIWGGGYGGNNTTQVVAFVHGMAPNSAHEAHIHQGTCASPGEGMIEYPLTDIETNGLGEGVSGTLLNTTMNILNFPAAVSNGNSSSSKGNGSSSNSKAAPPNSMRLSINVHGLNFKPLACGDLPYSSQSWNNNGR